MSPLSSSHPELQSLRRLSRRRSARSEDGSYLVDGPVLLAEALAAGAAVRVVYVEPGTAGASVEDVIGTASAAGIPVREVREGALAKVVDLATPQSVVAVVGQRSDQLAEVVERAAAHGRPLLVLADVADPGNVGTLIRTAEAAGCAGAVLVGSCADLHNPKTVRATAGSVFRLPVATGAGLAEVHRLLAGHGMAFVGTVGTAGVAPEDVPLAGAVAVLVGNEAHGLSPEAVSFCDELITIPMDGRTESLNAAVAGSVVAFEAARQRRVAVAPGAMTDRSRGAASELGHNVDPVATGTPTSAAPAPEHGSPPR